MLANRALLLWLLLLVPISALGQTPEVGRNGEFTYFDERLEDNLWSYADRFGLIGSLSNEKLCAAVDDNLPGFFGGVLLGTLELLGACGDLEEMYNNKAREYCEAGSAITRTALIANGQSIPGIKITDCSYTDQEVSSCNDLVELCKQSGIRGYVVPPTKTSRPRFGGSVHIPGCRCSVSYLALSGGIFMPIEVAEIQ